VTSSLLDVRRGSQTPRVANYPPYPLSAAPEVIDFAAHCGLYLDEWQRYVLTHGLGCRVDGSWCATRCSVWVPRQNGKGGIIEALELAWLFLFDEELIIHSAHQHRTAQRAYDRLERIIRRTPDIHRMVRQYRQANGEQGIELFDGRELQYTTRSRTAVRGFSAPKVVLDEAQELNSEQIAAMLPTVSAMPNWQIWFLGTPPDDPGAWCYGLKEDGERSAPRLAHFDWGADLDLKDPDDLAKTHDPDTWYATNPAGGIRIAHETMQDEDTPSGLGEKFPQERLGVWKPRATGGAGVISQELWRDQADPKSKRPTDVALAVVVNHRRTHTSIMAVGPRPGGGLLTSIVDYRPGTHWVVARAAELKAKYNPVAIAVQDKGATGSLLDEMAKAGLKPSEDRDKPKRGELAIPWADDVADAYGLYVDAANERRLWHLDEAPLNAALAAAGIRPLSGGTAWDYKGDTDPSPLLASTLALWAYVTRVDAVTETYDALNNIW
jgi:phage terminase large subunit-like protein